MTEPEPKVWITRAEPGASATAERVRALGLTPLVAPLLDVRRLDTPLDMEGVVALAFTSANGVNAFAARSTRRDFQVFAVGDATADAARAAGFDAVMSANDDGAGLVRLIADARPAGAADSGAVLALGPTRPAVDLVGGLARAGVVARSVVLYETSASETFPEAARLALMNHEVAAVLIHSTRAAEALARLAGSCDLTSVGAVGLSGACIAPLASLKLQVRIAASAPREDALLAALLAALGKRPVAR